jgi:DNA-binding MarR family transcriptional regulator
MIGMDPIYTTNLTPAEKLALLAITAEPSASIERLASITGMEAGVVARAIRTLKKRGLMPSKAA